MITSILILALFFIHSIQSAVITSNQTDIKSKSFDYIIVGGGLSGLVIANRLSSDNKTSVLVIDAGRDARNDPLYNDPGNAVAVENSTENWRWNTTVQASSGKILTILGGHVLGGSSSINGLDWTRASTAQYDAIEALGNPGWNFKSLMSYMKKAEKFHPPTPEQASRGATFELNAHGTNGKVGTGFYTPYEPYKFYQLFLSAAVKVFGIVKGKDLCTGNPNIASVQMFSLHSSPSNSSQNLRSSSAVSYLYPIAPGPTHSKLIVLAEHQATRIVFSNSTGDRGLIASGVEFASSALGNQAKYYYVKANKEVIVCAGAIMSPHLLQLSGVGNPKILKKFGIKVNINLPSIGTGLQDQALNVLLCQPTLLAFSNPDLLPSQNVPGASVVAMPSLKQLVGKAGAKAIVKNLKDTATSRALSAVNRGAWSNVAGLTKIYLAQADIISGDTPITEVSAQLFPTLYLFTPWNLLPQTRGSVTLASNNPFDLPVVDPAYLDDDFDFLVQTASLKASRTLTETSFILPLIQAELIPGLDIIPKNASDLLWSEYVKQSARPVYHPVGTVAMMSRELGGSVDSSLRLYGSENIRVVDASILPFQISAHLSSTLYGVAEKAADIIISQKDE